MEHVMFFGIFFILSFRIFGYPLWYLMRMVMPASISLVSERAWFSPVIAGETRVDYIGFVLPLVASLAAILFLIRSEHGSWRPSRDMWVLLAIVPVSIILSSYTPLGIFVSAGLTDPILLITFSVILYHQTLFRNTTQAALLSYPLGFMLGFISDLESTVYFKGVFGGYGLGDGDFVFPLAFLVGTLLFSSTWKATLDGIHNLEFRVQAALDRRRRH